MRKLIILAGLLPASFLAVRNDAAFCVETVKVSGGYAAADFTSCMITRRHCEVRSAEAIYMTSCHW
jgi:hypothetical protein